MDDFKENEQVEESGESEQSTIFSAPEEHKDKDLKSPKKRRITAVISAVLAVLVLVGGTLAVIKFIPTLEDKENTSSTEDNTITVIDSDSAKFDTVTVENKNGTFDFYKETVESESSDDSSSEPQINWYLKDIAKDKISLDKTGEIVSAAAKITATMEITKKTSEECGLSEPTAKVSVKSKELGDFSITVGDISPDNTGVYLSSSKDKKIYLVSSSLFDTFSFTDLDLAGAGEVPAISVDTDSEDYFDGNGNLASFDKLEISGSKYARSITIRPVEEEEGETVAFAYKVVSPVERYAETDAVTKLFGVFSTGISVSGTYSLETDDETLKEFGLDDPDAVLTLTVDKQTFTYKFALRDDGFYALCGDGISTIKKISAASATFLDIEETDFYNKLVYIRSISEVKNMTFDLKDKSYGFSIKENGEDDEEKFTVYYGKNLIKSENFQNFYMHFVSLSLMDFSFKEGGETVLTITITDNDGKVDILTFNKASATEYYCSLSGEPIGKITASSFNKFLSDLETVSQNKDVESD
ncbi:MAG: DUF4340 domain-containing protein [Clostridia bacterium]|nr:DUF4340 domain-containing protein [Clostridia bacterium]